MGGKALNVASNAKYNEYKWGLVSMVYKCFDKNSSSSNTSGRAIKSEIMLEQQLAKQLHKPIRRILKIVKYIHHL